MKLSVWIGLLALAACAPADNGGMAAEPKPVMAWDDLLGRPKPVADRTIAYGADPLQVVDLWLPEGAAPHPAVIMIHGGCWLTDVADRSIMNWIAADLRGQGIAVWNVEYRGVDRPGGGYPGTFQDIAAAADLFVKDGARHGLKTDRVVAIGHSAGGHLALWLAARGKADTAISQGGLPDLRYLAEEAKDHGCGVEGARGMAGKPSAERPDVYADTSPIAMTPGKAAQIQINTTRDPIAPPAYADAYAKALSGKGVTVRNVTVADEGHIELVAPGSNAWLQTVPLIRAALGLDSKRH